jgi:uncharacterized protein with PIN domain
MTKPMENKSYAIKSLIEEVFPGTAKALSERRCPVCKESIKGFKNALSEKEYQISGMCQKCQDSIWPDTDPK